MAEAFRNCGGMTKVMLLNVNDSGVSAVGWKVTPLNVTTPPRSELNQPRFAVVQPVALPVVQADNPKAPLKVVTLAAKPSPAMFTVALGDIPALTRVAIPTANNWRSRDVGHLQGAHT